MDHTNLHKYSNSRSRAPTAQLSRISPTHDETKQTIILRISSVAYTPQFNFRQRRILRDDQSKMQCRNRKVFFSFISMLRTQVKARTWRRSLRIIIGPCLAKHQNWIHPNIRLERNSILHHSDCSSNFSIKEEILSIHVFHHLIGTCQEYSCILEH